MAKSMKDMATERSLPHSIETERSILGAILIDNTTLHQALEVLSRDDFYLDAHRRIFEKMVALFEKDRPIDPITLREELDRSGELEQVGGVSAIAALMDGTPYLRNIEHYAKIVRDRALLRRLIVASNQIISECFEQEEESDLILDKAEKAILSIAEARTKVGFAPIGEVAKQQLELVEQRAGRPQTITGLATGFIDFDRMTSGLQPSDLIIIAARPSVGKTSFVLSVAQNAALAGHVIGISSLEMSKEQLVMRLLCSEARINMHRFRSGFLNRDEWKRLAEGLRRLAECRIFIDDTPGITSLELRAKARRLQHERGLDLLIVDYLQLMSARGRAESRQQEVSQISRDLKTLAKDLRVPLIAVSQLSRAPEARTDHRPQLSDLRESGSLEQDADVVAFLFREDIYNKTPETEGKAELILAKQRNGPTGTIELAFLREFTRFENLMEEAAF